MTNLSLEILPWMYAVVLFLMGLAVGSFLNVVIYRAPLDKSLLFPGSFCPKCYNKIKARDNIPVVAWLLLGGKCRVCKHPISFRYPLIELLTAVLWAYAGYRIALLPYGARDNILLGLTALAFLSAMIVTFFVDWDHQIILDEITLGGTAVALVLAVVVPALHHAVNSVQFAAYHPFLNVFLGTYPGWMQSLGAALIGLVVGLVLALAIYGIGNVAFRKQIREAQELDPEIDSALGLGDVKFMALVGCLLGAPGALFTFFAGSVLAAIIGTVGKLYAGSPQGKTGWAALQNRWRTGDSIIPFGPFLVVAAVLYFFWSNDIQRVLFAFALQG